MGILARISRFFRSRGPSAAAVFQTAFRHGATLRLRFIDKNRSVHDLDCHIQSIKNRKIFLALVHPLACSLFNGEKCLIHFKISREILKRELGIRRDPGQNAFFCNSGINFCEGDQDGMTQIIRINMPKNLIRREWRHYPRFNVSSSMIPAAFISLKDMIPRQNEKEDEPYFAARLINISAGGAKVILEDTEYLDAFVKIDKSKLLLRLSLNILGGSLLDVWVPCECVSSSYSIQQRKLTMHLRFLAMDAPKQNSAGDMIKDTADLSFLQRWLKAHMTES